MQATAFIFVAFFAIVIGNSIAFECVPGTSHKKDCNTCTCLANGKSLSCTAMPCPGKPGPWKVVRCTPLAVFADDCNTCLCGPNGRASQCTHRLCPSQIPSEFKPKRSIMDIFK